MEKHKMEMKMTARDKMFSDFCNQVARLQGKIDALAKHRIRRSNPDLTEYVRMAGDLFDQVYWQAEARHLNGAPAAKSKGNKKGGRG